MAVGEQRQQSGEPLGESCDDNFILCCFMIGSLVKGKELWVCMGEPCKCKICLWCRVSLVEEYGVPNASLHVYMGLAVTPHVINKKQQTHTRKYIFSQKGILLLH